jgi:hypothetical protein
MRTPIDQSKVRDDCFRLNLETACRPIPGMTAHGWRTPAGCKPPTIKRLIKSLRSGVVARGLPQKVGESRCILHQRATERP